MAAMQAVVDSDRASSRSTAGRVRRGDGKTPGLARAASGATPDEETQALIYRQSRRGFSVEVLAAQFGLGRSQCAHSRQVEGLRTCWKRSSSSCATRVSMTRRPSPRLSDRRRRSARLPAGPGRRRVCLRISASLYELPLLSPEQERHLFRKMNYLKYQAHQLRRTLDPDRCKAAELDEIERLQAEALAVKNQIIRANLRLVVSIAKKRVGPTNNFFELVSDGNMSLIRAVEKFDASRGFKFSTYASWALMKNFSRSIPEERHRRDRFVTGHDQMFQTRRDARSDVYERRAASAAIMRSSRECSAASTTASGGS